MRGWILNYNYKNLIRKQTVLDEKELLSLNSRYPPGMISMAVVELINDKCTEFDYQLWI